MSVWSTLSSGLQIVQDKLDHVLEGDQTDGEKVEQADDPGMASSPPEMEPESDPSPAVLNQPSSPKKTAQLPEAMGETESLRQALVESEQQLQLINTEYRRLLGEKESEIQALKRELSTGQGSSSAIGGPSMLEVAQKELAAHKEMVTELRKQLIEKEQEFQELNSKAETKFNKLKTQAKTKIAALNKEVERLKGDKGEDTSFNVSALTLDDSVSSSVGGALPQLDSLRSEVRSKETLILDLREELDLMREEKDKMATQFAAIRDRLNVSEVCLEKEKEKVVKLELLVTELEDQVGQVSDELTVSVNLHKKVVEELKSEKEANQTLQSQVTELTNRQDEGGMKQVPSFASSGVQVISEGASQVDSEEDGGTSDKSGSPIHMATSSPTVLAAGSRGSLLDMEAEISHLEASLQEKDEQLSSFKAILEEKEQLLQQEQQTNSGLTAKLEETVAEKEREIETKSGEIQQLQSQLVSSQNTVEQCESDFESLQSTNDGIIAQNETYSAQIKGLQQKVEVLSSTLSETECSRDSLQKEVQSYTIKIAQNEEQLADKDGIIEGLQQTIQEIQSTYRSLQTNLTKDRQTSAEEMEENLKQIQELESRILELQQDLECKEIEVSEQKRSNQQLEEKLVVTRENLQESMNTSQREYGELEASLMSKVAGEEGRVRQLEEKIKQNVAELAVSSEKLEATLQDLNTKESKLLDSQNKVQELVQKEEATQRQTAGLEDKCARVSGALEFAQKELSTRDNTIKSLSQTLEEKKAAISSLESEIARVKSDNADKLTEVMQRSEQALQTRADLESKLGQLQRELEKKELELAHNKESLDKFRTEDENLRQELAVVQSQLSVLQQEKEASQVERESLRGQVNDLSQLESSFSLEQTRFETEVADLKSRLTQETAQVAELQQKVRNAKQQLQRASKAKQEWTEKKERLENDLEKYRSENEQMKQQFESAVKLMETKSADQSSALTQATQQLSEKESLLSSINTQLSTERQAHTELNDKFTKVSADCKVSTERCQFLEQEKQQFSRKVSELSVEQSQVSQLLTDTQSARDSLKREYDTVLRDAQQRESKVIELTQQLGQLAREKEEFESKVRDLSRQLVCSEQGKLSVSAELEELRRRSEGVKDWEREKLALLGDRETLEQERSALQSTESLLQAQVGQLQGQVEQLQQELQGVHAELETSHRGSEAANASLVEDLQKRLTNQQETHLAEVTQLQQALQQESTRRETAEKMAEELKGEVAISMEGVGPATGGEETTQPQNFMEYVEIAKTWFQRFIKNPNVVLMRLYRATPQTKLFFLGYFALLHLLLLYLIFV